MQTLAVVMPQATTANYSAAVESGAATFFANGEGLDKLKQRGV